MQTLLLGGPLLLSSSGLSAHALPPHPLALICLTNQWTRPSSHRSASRTPHPAIVEVAVVSFPCMDSLVFPSFRPSPSCGSVQLPRRRQSHEYNDCRVMMHGRHDQCEGGIGCLSPTAVL
jgi:hypothetical protein